MVKLLHRADASISVYGLREKQEVTGEASIAVTEGEPVPAFSH
jgi:hypothetical protein